MNDATDAFSSKLQKCTCSNKKAIRNIHGGQEHELDTCSVHLQLYIYGL